MGYKNYRIVENLPRERRMRFPEDTSQTVGHTFVSLMLRVVASDTADYLSPAELEDRIRARRGTGQDPDVVPRYWFGSWRTLAEAMWETPDEATRTRIRRAWRTLCVMGLAKRYCRRTPRGWEYTHRLTIGRDPNDEMYIGLTDGDVEDHIEEMMAEEYPDAREWPYA